MNERAEQLKAVMADEAFVKACIEAENEETVQKLFADKGVEMSLGEIELMKEMFGAVEEGKLTQEQLEQLANGGELSEEELSEAAGGSWFTELFKTTIQVPTGGRHSSIHAVRNQAGEIIHFTKVEVTEYASKIVTSAPKVAAGVVVGLVAAAGLGYGVYDAIRRRW